MSPMFHWAHLENACDQKADFVEEQGDDQREFLLNGLENIQEWSEAETENTCFGLPVLHHGLAAAKSPSWTECGDPAALD